MLRKWGFFILGLVLILGGSYLANAIQTAGGVTLKEVRFAGDQPSLTQAGLLYTPPACASGAPCKLVVALHGCLSGQYLLGDKFPDLANLDTYADTNNLEILYPQAIASVAPYNPEGCWDWWGYDGPDFAVKSAPQMITDRRAHV